MDHMRDRSLLKDLFIRSASGRPIVLFYFVLLCFVSAAGCSGEGSHPPVSLKEKESDAKKAGLYGRVKMVRVESAKFHYREGGWVEGARHFASTARYNEKGDLAEEVFYKPSGLLAVRVVYTYDSQGRHAEEAVFKGEAVQPSRLVYHHNPSGQVVEKMVYRADGAFDWKVLLTYDDSGNKKEVAVYQADGSLSARRVYRHDREGNEVEETVHSSDALVSRGVYTYDGKGNRTEELFSLPKGTVSARYLYAYLFDEVGNWTMRTRSGIDLESGNVDFEQSNITYRTILYY